MHKRIPYQQVIPVSASRSIRPALRFYMLRFTDKHCIILIHAEMVLERNQEVAFETTSAVDISRTLCPALQSGEVGSWWPITLIITAKYP